MTRVLSKNLIGSVSQVFKFQKNRNLPVVGANSRKVGTTSAQTSTAAAAAPLPENDSKFWVKSPHQDVQKMVGYTVPELVWSQITKFPNATALECVVSGKKYTFGEIYKYARGFAAALIRSGFKRGDVIGIVLPNIPEYPIVLFGAWEAGLTVSPINPSYTTDEIKRQVLSSETKCVVTVDFFLDSIRQTKESNKNLTSIIVIGDAREGCHSFSEMIKSDITGVEFSKGSQFNTEEEIALLPYSSGTTGPPKGVMLTHSNMTTNIKQFVQSNVASSHSLLDTGEQERLLGLLPFFHSYGLAAILVIGLYQGSYTMSLPRFEPKLFHKAVVDHKPTVMHLVTPIISYIVNSPDYGKAELQHCHTIIGAAAPIGSSLINRLAEKAEKYIFFQEGYGMTELSPLSHILSPSFKLTKVGSCGAPIPSTWSKVVDLKTGECLGPNLRGEICVKGPQVMKGYFKNDEATRNTIDADGWLHTGDIGFYDEDKCFYIVDRLKELIKVKGFQVAPSELEDILRKHPEVEDVAVIGVPDEESGELPRAYIVRKSENLQEENVHEYLKPVLAAYKQLHGGIVFTKTIPKAPSGKLLRRELLEAYKKENNIPL